MNNTKKLFTDFHADMATMRKAPKGKKWVDTGNFDKQSIANRRTMSAVGLAAPTGTIKPNFEAEGKAMAASNKKVNLQRMETELETNINFQRAEFKARTSRGAPPFAAQRTEHDLQNAAVSAAREKWQANEVARIDEIYAGQCIQFPAEIEQQFNEATQQASRIMENNEAVELRELLSDKTDREVINAIAKHVGITAESFS